MKKESFFSISEFSKLSDISRKALIFYDKAGLFPPARVDENGYRYYSSRQIELITVINILTELGMPLKEVKECMKSRTPCKAVQLLEQQASIIRHKVKHLNALQDMIEMRLSQINRGITLQNRKFPAMDIVEIMKPVPFFRSIPFRCSKANIPDRVFIDFYNQCEECGIPFGYSVGYMITREDVVQGNYDIASGICFRMKNTKYANMTMPAGKYVVVYASCDYGGNTDDIYAELIHFTEKNNYSIKGYSCEEYLLDELATANTEEYLIQISVPIE